MQLLSPNHWKDFELIDSGNKEKLERYGKYYLIRPEPQALWNRSLPREEWERKSNAEFRIDKTDPERGRWLLKDDMPEQWWINYFHSGLKLRFRLGLTAFRHIGLFPEQAVNWDFIYHFLRSVPVQQPKILNLFAYTGGASLAARAAGAEVVHVDSVKPVISWARENMEGSKLTDIRWIVEDALKFVKREVRRGSIYQGILLDPPAYGRGADGEKWVLDDQINEMIMLCSSLLAKKDSFLILNMYSLGFSALVAENLINSYFDSAREKELGELFLKDSFGNRLPLGTFLRMTC